MCLRVWPGRPFSRTSGLDLGIGDQAEAVESEDDQLHGQGAEQQPNDAHEYLEDRRRDLGEDLVSDLDLGLDRVADVGDAGIPDLP